MEGGLKDVAAIFALHCFPQLPAGLVGGPLRVRSPPPPTWSRSS